MFQKMQSSVVKITDPDTLKNTRAENITILQQNWKDLPVESRNDICHKVGIHQNNYEKNIKLLEESNFETFKDSKLQKMTYLSKLYKKLYALREK